MGRGYRKDTDMGDRGNIVVLDEIGPPIYLYSHWGGYDLGDTLSKALAREQRWDDGSYLARIIFDTMTEGDHGSETGFGIATYAPDNEYPYLVVDVARQRVVVLHPDYDPAALRDGDDTMFDPPASVPFSEHHRITEVFRGDAR